MPATITHVWTEGEGALKRDMIRIETAEGIVDTRVQDAMKQQSWKAAGLAQQYHKGNMIVGKPDGPKPIAKGKNV